MPLFAVICRDVPGKVETRLASREAHLAFLKAGSNVLFAGPLIEEGEPRGSLIVIEAEDLDSAWEWAGSDPYKDAGVFDRVDITEWKKVIG